MCAWRTSVCVRYTMCVRYGCCDLLQRTKKYIVTHFFGGKRNAEPERFRGTNRFQNVSWIAVDFSNQIVLKTVVLNGLCRETCTQIRQIIRIYVLDVVIYSIRTCVSDKLQSKLPLAPSLVLSHSRTCTTYMYMYESICFSDCRTVQPVTEDIDFQ